MLDRLVGQLAQSAPGADYSLCVVSNRDKINDAEDAIWLGRIREVLEKALHGKPWQPQDVYVALRENTGMNIGAWNHAWQFQSHHDTYLFLQDEVILQRPNWLAQYAACGQMVRGDGNGFYLLGESFNNRWQLAWSSLRQSSLNVYAPGHPPDQRRVDFYLQCMRQWEVDPGADGGHLRSLVWFSNRQTLDHLAGFRLGRGYGECIAAEIAASRAVLAAGGVVQQIEQSPFAVFWHPEWRKDGLAKIKMKIQ